MEDSKKSLIQKLGPEAVVTVVIAAIAVLVTVVAFQQHTIDFEQAAHRDIQRIEDRITNVEERERSDTLILIRVDTRVKVLQEDVTSLQGQVAEVLARLPSKSN